MLPVTAPLKKILLIEDDDDIRTILRVALEKIGGFTVRACSSGAEGLGAVAEFAPQLVMLDVMMPGMDGPAVLGRLRERPETTQLPVIFLTARAAPPDIARLRGLGALDVLTKPFDPMTLHEKLHKAWEQQAAKT
jgi:two-component system, OmpR family, response regulator